MKKAAEPGRPEHAERLGPALTFIRALWALDSGLAARSKAMARRLGVTGPQRLALRILARLGPMSPGRLAALLHVHPASVTRLAVTLEKRRLLRRRPDPEDGRRLVLELAPAAAPLIRAIPGTIEAAVDAALGGATRREVTAALRLLTRITEALHGR
jgi:DNA-binding MarR family transcriptional regulator